MRPIIALIHLLVSVGAAPAHPATNDLHNNNPDQDTPEAFRYFEVFHDKSVTAGSIAYNQASEGVNLTAMGYVGPRTDVDKNAALNIPNEPTGNYNTLLKREHLYYGASNPWHDEAFHAPFTHYDPALCGRMCTSITKEAWALHPFINGAAAVCNMFVAYELQMRIPTKYEKAGTPVSMVCELYSSVWSSRYQGVVEVQGEVHGRHTMLKPTRVSIYDRGGYSYPPICAMEELCGEDYYAGGDCSGWGDGHCRESV
ncbi:hypothetical protein VM1G_10021 [Cytospora mali]|uniref:Uncharacterized protein n=1 Tax=Cytospora mali TaxID=578113 RepID=A0A194WDI5_CYTMA|nr:hypothetical protein VM1G_10021 [Valsa mali]